MIQYKITDVKSDDKFTNVPTDAQISAEDIAKTSAELNAGLPDWPAGMLIHSPGYDVVKEKGMDGSWVEV